MFSGDQTLPVNRQFPRFKLEAPIGVQRWGQEVLRGSDRGCLHGRMRWSEYHACVRIGRRMPDDRR